MAQEYGIINNINLQRFEFHEGDAVAFLEYRFQKNDIAFIHTEVPESMEGRGVGSALVKFAFEYAKEQGKPVKIYCPFVETYLERHPEFINLVDKNSE